MYRNREPDTFEKGELLKAEVCREDDIIVTADSYYVIVCILSSCRKP